MMLIFNDLLLGSELEVSVITTLSVGFGLGWILYKSLFHKVKFFGNIKGASIVSIQATIIIVVSIATLIVIIKILKSKLGLNLQDTIILHLF